MKNYLCHFYDTLFSIVFILAGGGGGFVLDEIVDGINVWCMVCVMISSEGGSGGAEKGGMFGVDVVIKVHCIY